MLQQHSDWTSMKRKEEEMPGTLQSLTLIFSFYLRVQISVSLGEVTFHILWMFVSFLLKLLCCACVLLRGQEGMEGK